MLIVPVASFVVVVLFLGILGWRVPRYRNVFALAAPGLAGLGGIGASLKTYAEYCVAQSATDGVYTDSVHIDYVQSEQILGEAYAAALPRLAASGAVLVAGLIFCLVCTRSNGARLLATAGVCVVLAPLVWLGTRGIGLHERTFRAALAKADTSWAGCRELEGAIEFAGSVEEAARIEPRVKDDARVCVASWLEAIDDDGAAKRQLAFQAEVYRSLHPGSSVHPDALGRIENSVLLFDEGQRRAVARRRATAGM